MTSRIIKFIRSHKGG